MLDQNDVSVSTAIDEDYFASAELTQKMNLLLHLTENGDRIALIKGQREISISSAIYPNVSRQLAALPD